MPEAVPNYLSVGNDGKVSAVFPGGVEIQADDSSSTSYTPTRTVRWEETTPGGPLVAMVAATTGANLDQSFIYAGKGGPSDNFASMALEGSKGGVFSRVWMNVKGPLGASFVNVIMDDGGSDFVQGQNTGGVCGTVNQGVNFWAGYVFNLPAAAKRGLLFIAAGSGYVNAAPANVNYRLLIDGSQIATSDFSFNSGSQHLMLPLLIGKTGYLSKGNHTIQFSNPSSSLAVDANDACAAAWIG
jgi:hypothetical protein